MADINLIKGSTRTRLQISQDHPYFQYFRNLFREILSDYEWDKRFHKYVLMNRYYYYGKVAGAFYIPAAYTQDVIDHLNGLNTVYETRDEPLVKGRTIHLKMKKNFSPRPEQVAAIDYLAGETPYNKGLSLMTGGGKTVVTIAAIVKRKKAAMIVTSGLTDQWYKAFKDFTTAKDDVVIIQGIHSLMKLIEEDRKPSIIIFSLETLRRYVGREENYKDLPPYEKFIEYFGIDTKVVDECHLNFKTNTFIDLHSNIRNSVYLTATFTSSNAQTRKIFNKIYPVDIRYGASKRDKYIDIYSYSYQHYVPPKCYTKMRGYSHVGYEKYFFKRPNKMSWFFNSILFPIINSHYENRCAKGQRLLIFFSTINMIMAAKDFLTRYYPNRKVGVYIGDSKKMAYNDYEIIISNYKKAGTGTDIKQLYVVINTISFGSPTLTEQMLGRLRRLPDGTTPRYIELVNTYITQQVHHRRSRQEIQKRLSQNYYETNLP